MKKAIFYCYQHAWDEIYRGPVAEAFRQRVGISDTLLMRENWRQHLEVLHAAEILVSSWGGPVLDEEFLTAAPNVKLCLYGAGSIKDMLSDAAWERGIRITSAAEANAIPVAEFVLSQVIFSLKRGWEYMRLAKENIPVHWLNKPVRGMYGSKVGILALGRIGRKICELLKAFDTEVLVYSIEPSADLEKELGIRFVSLEEVFRTSDVISIHLPSNPETQAMIGKELLSLMKPKSTLINTARGAVVNQLELIEFLRERPDVFACIDVTDPEPPEPDSPLRELPNVVLTPHLAGTMGLESPRLGWYMLEELDRYLAGQPLQWEITRELAATLA